MEEIKELKLIFKGCKKRSSQNMKPLKIEDNNIFRGENLEYILRPKTDKGCDLLLFDKAQDSSLALHLIQVKLGKTKVQVETNNFSITEIRNKLLVSKKHYLSLLKDSEFKKLTRFTFWIYASNGYYSTAITKYCIIYD